MPDNIGASDAFSSAATMINGVLGPVAASAFSEMIDSINANAAAASARAFDLRAWLDNFYAMSHSAYSALDSIESSQLSAQVLSRRDQLIHELARVDFSMSAAREAQLIEAEVGAAIRHLGTVVSAIDLLSTISNPNVSSSDAYKNAVATVASGLAAGAVTAVFGATVAPVAAATAVGVGFSWVAKEIWDDYIAPNFGQDLFWDDFYSFDVTREVAFQINALFRAGLVARRPPGDPLAIDLDLDLDGDSDSDSDGDSDGDGLETVGIGSNPVLFDHNADGIRTGTGWVRGDDAWLALDRNANGAIDSSREPFDVDTLLSGTHGVDAVYARTGFQALSALRGNVDGVFDAADAALARVRLWRDLDQDRVSDSGELITLAQYIVASISLNATSTNTSLGNGNFISGTATITRSNGSTTQVAAVGVANDTTAANLNLSVNSFFREFTAAIPLSTAAQALPGMGGSGWVYDLREAMSLIRPIGRDDRSRAHRSLRMAPRLSARSYVPCH